MSRYKRFCDFVNESKLTAPKMVSMFKNEDDWGQDTKDRIYTKGKNLVYGLHIRGD